jgi:hypothetical protein
MIKYSKIFLSVQMLNIVSLTLFCFLLLPLQFGIAGDASPISMTYEQFEALSSAAQKNVLVKAFEKRVRISKNIYVSTETTGEQRHCSSDGQIGEIITHYPPVSCSLWIQNNKYRIDVTRYLFLDNSIIDEMTAVFDLNEGLHQGMAVLKGNRSRIFGRIDTVQDTVAFCTTNYWYWLHDDYCDKKTDPHFQQWDYFFPDLLRQRENWNISLVPEDKIIRLTYPPSTKHAIKVANNERSYILDPSKGFIPLSVKTKIDEVLDDAPKWFPEPRKFEMDIRLKVKESKLIDDIWMPIVFEIWERVSWIEGKINFFQMKVKDISFSKVSATDTDFKYPEGTDVVDAIKGVHYKTDANGEPIESTIEPLYGLDPSQVKLPEPPKRKINIVFIVAGILLIVTALYLQFRKRRNKN